MKRVTVLGMLIAIGSVSIAVKAAQQAPPPEPSVDNITVEKVKDNLFVICAAAAATPPCSSPRRASRSSTPRIPGWGQPLLDKVKTLTDKPVTTVINTHLHYDHVSGNVAMPATAEIVAHAYTAKNIANAAAGRGHHEQQPASQRVQGKPRQGSRRSARSRTN